MNYIYKITNKVDGKIYIGQHTWKGEGLDPNYFCSSGNPHFWNAIKKYGMENFEKSILEVVEIKQELDERETYWIEFYKSYDRKIGYNLMNSARNFSYCHTPEIREKAIASLKSKYGESLSHLNNPITKQKAMTALTEKYGSPTGSMNTEESKLKSQLTRIERYGTLSVLTKEQRRTQSETRKLRNGGKMWTKEAIAKRSKSSSIKKRIKYYWYYEGCLVYIGNNIWAKRKMRKLDQKWTRGEKV